MEKINSGYHKKDGTELWYVINDNGFDIYFGENAKYPSISQPEPYIPYPNLSYDENAKKMCESMHSDGTEEKPKTVEDRLTDIEANVDYLMLLNDADSATEEETK